MTIQTYDAYNEYVGIVTKAAKGRVIIMVIIGMLHHRKDPLKVIKSYAYSVVAKAEGAAFIYFTPKSVDFINRKINGYVYDNGEWQKVQSPFPDVIYNAGSPEKLAKSKEIIEKLKEEIPFTTYSIGNKMSVYGRLKSTMEFIKYLIPSQIIRSNKGFFNYFKIYQKIVFKPVNGRKGQGVTFIERIQDNYRVIEGKQQFIFNYDQIKSYISNRIKQELYMVQPYINCKTKYGKSYDIRLHTQKDGEGNWLISSIYPRISPSGSIVSNINNGGSTNYLEPFLRQEFGDDYYNVKRYLEHFSIQLSQHIDKIQKDYFGETIDELGIDVGLDDMGKIWIYEINWRPGCPPTFYLELDSVRNMIRYAIFLAHKNQAKKLYMKTLKEGENIIESAS
jgi:UDP-N-acetylmuramoyl-tripeptide--D-alanyl-D-alanine ligase